MGAQASRLKESFARLVVAEQAIPIQDDAFWEVLWAEPVPSLPEVFEFITSEDIHTLKTKCPKNLATLIRRAVLKLNAATATGVGNYRAQAQVLNVAQILTRIIPYIYEDTAWDGFWWTDTPIGVVVTMPPGSTQSPNVADRESTVEESSAVSERVPLIITLVNAIIDLCFAPGFTCGKPAFRRHPHITPTPEGVRPVRAVPADEYIWAAGVEFATALPFTPAMDGARTTLLRLLLVCLSKTLYTLPAELKPRENKLLAYICGGGNAKVLPLFKSMLNVLLGYDPIGWGVPYGQVWVPDLEREGLLELSGQLIMLLLDHKVQDMRDAPPPNLATMVATAGAHPSGMLASAVDSDAAAAVVDAGASSAAAPAPLPAAPGTPAPAAAAPVAASPAVAPDTPAAVAAAALAPTASAVAAKAVAGSTPQSSPQLTGATPMPPRIAASPNVLAEWLAHVHAEGDLAFLGKGIARLLSTPLLQTWLPDSHKRVHLHEELIALFWRLLEDNPAFLVHVLKTTDIVNIIDPILYYINEARNDESQTGLLHIGVYVLLFLSGERNFAVRLNKLYEPAAPIKVSAFVGNYADLIILVLHNLLTSSNMRLTLLYDCLLTVIANISAYIKSLSLVAANKLVHLFEVFSSPRFLFAKEQNHHLVFYLLETFNNLIQYQFNGNHHLVYVLIRKRNVFQRIAALTVNPAAAHHTVAAASAGSAAFLPARGSSTVLFDPHSAVPGAAPPGAQASIASSLAPEEVKEHFTVAEKAAPSPAAVAVETGPAAPAFVPTEDWLQSWKSKLPLETTKRLLQVLAPQVEKICVDRGVTDEAEILDFLQNGTLVGLLPQPHPIMIRRYQTTPGPSVWFALFIWSDIYIKNLFPPIWHGTQIKLFRVRNER